MSWDSSDDIAMGKLRDAQNESERKKRENAKCSQCGGSGKYQKHSAKSRCPRCDGYGEYKQRNFFMPSTWNECPDCNGLGYIEYEVVRCDHCGGNGKEPEENRRKF